MGLKEKIIYLHGGKHPILWGIIYIPPLIILFLLPKKIRNWLFDNYSSFGKTYRSKHKTLSD